MIIPARRLNRHTDSYARWKKQTQDTFEFSVLVCTAVPTLKRNLKLYEKGVIDSLTKADHYGPAGELTKEQIGRVIPQMRKRAEGYKQKLSQYILISNFSFFESYVKDVIEEMVVFHGGAEKFTKTTSARAGKVHTNIQEVEGALRKLRGQRDPKNVDRSKNATNKLESLNYIFPSDLFASYGIRTFIRVMGNMFAKDIPSIIGDALHMPLTDDEILTFHNIRDARNNIAHGSAITIDLAKVTDMCKFLRSIALRLDQHIIRNYLISEIYR